jgi:hypothetical protein
MCIRVVDRDPAQREGPALPLGGIERQMVDLRHCMVLAEDVLHHAPPATAPVLKRYHRAYSAH